VRGVGQVLRGIGLELLEEDPVARDLAQRLAKDCIKKVDVLEYPELGMEAVWKIDVVDFPAFIVVDDKGNDFFAGMTGGAGDGKTRLAVAP